MCEPRFARRGGMTPPDTPVTPHSQQVDVDKDDGWGTYSLAHEQGNVRYALEIYALLPRHRTKGKLPKPRHDKVSPTAVARLFIPLP